MSSNTPVRITGKYTRRLNANAVTLRGGITMGDGGNGNVDIRVDGVTRVGVKNDGTVAVTGTCSVGGDLTESVNGILNTPVNKTLTGPDVLKYLQASRDSCAVTPGLDTVRLGPAGNGGLGGVLMRDGRVFIVPREGTSAYIFNPSTNTMSSVGSFPAGNKFYGGNLLQDGRVFFVPCETTYTNVFDPVSGTISTPNVTFPGGVFPFTSSVTLHDGRVFLCPYNSAYALLFNPLTNQLTTPNIGFSGTSAYFGATLMPDGKVFMVPNGTLSTRALIFDPVTLTATSTAASFGSGSQKYVGAVLMPNGNVYCIPASATTARIVNPLTLEVSTPPGTFPGNFAFAKGSLTPDGRVFIAPYNSTTARVFNPSTNTLSTMPGPAFGGGSTIGSILLPDGRTFVIPATTSNSRLVYTGSWGSTKLPMSVLTSSLVNKN